MLAVFHGANKDSHDSFQAWRCENPNGFHMTEGTNGKFSVHWTQDKRDSPLGRGCNHQGIAGMEYRQDKNGCYTTARKICSESLFELLAWIADREFESKSCGNCDSKKFPFPITQTSPTYVAATPEALEGRLIEIIEYSRSRSEPLRLAALKRAGGVCECCEINFANLLSGVGTVALQVHHTNPLSSRAPDGSMTKLDDLAVLCSNCHLLIHAFGSKPLSVLELRHRMNRPGF